MADFVQLSALVYYGANADTKPSVTLPTAWCIESDTGDKYYTPDCGATWVKIETGMANIDFGTVAEADFNAAADLALNTAIPGTNVANSVNDILLDQLKPTVGSMADSAATVVNTAQSLMAYLKAAVTPLLTFAVGVQAACAAALAAIAYKRQAGVTQVFQKDITSAANTNGLVTIATVTTAACLIKSIVVKAVTAAQTDLTSAAVKGGASQAITFISAVTAAKANITAIDQQVAWTGAVELAAAKTIVMDVQGTGATPINLLVTIEYEAAVDTGYLA